MLGKDNLRQAIYRMTHEETILFMEKKSEDDDMFTRSYFSPFSVRKDWSYFSEFIDGEDLAFLWLLRVADVDIDELEKRNSFTYLHRIAMKGFWMVSPQAETVKHYLSHLKSPLAKHFGRNWIEVAF